MSTRPYDPFKRALDAAGSAVLIVLTAPVLAVVAAVVALRLGRPVLFTQERPGRDGRIFRLRKFRSMRPVDAARGLVDDADRLTPFGRALRASSLDELPTLWNVLTGEMSFVGPRPLLPAYLDRYTVEQARRHEVRPGITGLAQVSGRNVIEWGERLRLDVDYVDSRSFALDLRILLATVRTVLRRDGVSAQDHVTMPEFLGTEGGPT